MGANETGLLVTIVLNVLSCLALGACILLVRFIFPYTFHCFDNYYRQNDELISMSWWAKVKTFVFLNTEDIVRARSVDVLMYMRFLRLCLVAFTIYTVVGLLIILPVNVEEGTETLIDGGLESMTMNNIGSGSGIVWLHLVHTYFNTLVLYVLWYREMKVYKRVRHQFKNSIRPRNFTVLIQGMPRLTVPEMKHVLSRISTDISSIQVVPRSSSLRSLMIRRNKHVLAHSRALEKKDLDALHKHSAAIKQIDMDVVDKRERWSKKHDQVEAVSAFVTFDSIASAAICEQIVVGRSAKRWRIVAAPDPQEIRWQHLNLSIERQLVRTLGVWSFYLILAFYGAVGVTFISAVSNIEAFAEGVGAGFLVSWIDSYPVIRASIESYLPPVMVMLYVACIPQLMYDMSKVEGRFHSQTMLEIAVLNKLHFFLIINVLIISALGNSFFSKTSEIVDSPRSTLTDISAAFAITSSFFMNYYLNAAFNGNAIRALKIWYKGIMIFKTITARSQREKVMAQRPPMCFFGMHFARHVMFLSMGLIFSSIAPLISVFALLYFFIAHWVDAYNLIYCFRNNFDGGGRLYPYVFRWSIVGMFIYQLITIGVLYSKEEFVAGGMGVPLLIMDVLFLLFVEYRYISPAEALAMEAVGEDGDEFGPIVLCKEHDYLHPYFVPQARGESQRWGSAASWWLDMEDDSHLTMPDKEMSKELYEQNIKAGRWDHDTDEVMMGNNNRGKPQLASIGEQRSRTTFSYAANEFGLDAVFSMRRTNTAQDLMDKIQEQGDISPSTIDTGTPNSTSDLISPRRKTKGVNGTSGVEMVEMNGKGGSPALSSSTSKAKKNQRVTFMHLPT